MGSDDNKNEPTGSATSGADTPDLDFTGEAQFNEGGKGTMKAVQTGETLFGAVRPTKDE